MAALSRVEISWKLYGILSKRTPFLCATASPLNTFKALTIPFPACFRSRKYTRRTLRQNLCNRQKNKSDRSSNLSFISESKCCQALKNHSRTLRTKRSADVRLAPRLWRTAFAPTGTNAISLSWLFGWRASRSSGASRAKAGGEGIVPDSRPIKIRTPKKLFSAAKRFPGHSDFAESGLSAKSSLMSFA
jgi:hypothetical protein